MTLLLTEPLPAYTCPIELLTFQPTPADIKTVFKNGDYERKIYNNIELDPHEREAIAALRHLQKTAKIPLSRSMQCRILRFLSHTRNDEGKALQCLLVTQEWRKTHFRRPLSDTALRDKLRNGFSYFCGRDSGMRPMLFVRPKIALAVASSFDVSCVINLFTFCMEYALRYLFLPGKVESLNVVLDLDGMALLHYKDDRVRQLIRVMTRHYVGHLYKIYIINSPIWIGSIWSVFKSVLSDRQRAKTEFLKKPKDVCSGAKCARHQIEKQFGGTKPNLTQYYPFSFSPGPFTADYDGMPDMDAPKDAYRCINRITSVGMLAEDGPPMPLIWSSRGQDLLLHHDIPMPARDSSIEHRSSPSRRSDFPDDTDAESDVGSSRRSTKHFGLRPLEARCSILKTIVSGGECDSCDETCVEDDEEKKECAPPSPSLPCSVGSTRTRTASSGPTVSPTTGENAIPLLKTNLDSLSSCTETCKMSREATKDTQEPFSDTYSSVDSEDRESVLSDQDVSLQELEQALARLRQTQRRSEKNQPRPTLRSLISSWISSWDCHASCLAEKEKDVLELDVTQTTSLAG